MITAILDENLSYKLCQVFAMAGLKAISIKRCGLSGVSDLDIWGFAARAKIQSIYTKDQDFINLAENQPNGVQVVHMPEGNRVQHTKLLTEYLQKPSADSIVMLSQAVRKCKRKITSGRPGARVKLLEFERRLEL